MIIRFTGAQRYNYFINNLKINGKIISFALYNRGNANKIEKKNVIIEVGSAMFFWTENGSKIMVNCQWSIVNTF